MVVLDVFSILYPIKWLISRIQINTFRRTSKDKAVLIALHDTHNPSGRAMPLGSAQSPNRNEHQKYFLGGKGGRW